MARKKETTKPLFGLKHEFCASLDAALQQAIVLIQSVEQAAEFLRSGQNPNTVADILDERVKAFRDTLEESAIEQSERE